MKSPFQTAVLPALLLVCILSVYSLLQTLKKERSLVALAGLFFFAMGTFLLLLDLVLISITQGPQFIPDYLLFERLVSDTGFAGRWVLTVYIFLAAGIILNIYLLARKMIRKLNEYNRS